MDEGRWNFQRTHPQTLGENVPTDEVLTSSLRNTEAAALTVAFVDALYDSLRKNLPIFRSTNVVGFGGHRREKSCVILSTMEQQELIEKIKRLPQDRVAEVADFVDSLTRREHGSDRENLHQALADYANQHAGTDSDLDSDLEAAATDHLLQQDSEQ